MKDLLLCFLDMAKNIEREREWDRMEKEERSRNGICSSFCRGNKIRTSLFSFVAFFRSSSHFFNFLYI